MTHQYQKYQSGSRRLARVLRSAAAATVLIAVTAGLPWMFVRLAGSPIPHRLPSWDEITASLSHPDDGTLLLGFLTYLAWILWGVWTFLVLLEAIAQLRGRPAPRIPGLDGPQRLAALLITSLGAAVIGTSVSAMRASPLPATPSSLAASTAPPHRTASAIDQPGGSHNSSDPAAELANTSSHAGSVDLETAPLMRSASRPERRECVVRFAFDSTELSPAARDALRRAAGDIRKHADPGHPIVIVGHTDSLGPAAYNQRLSVQRARTVREALGSLVGPGFRYEVSGKGETQPLARERAPDGRDDPAARARNRRVEISYALTRPAGSHSTATPEPHRSGGDGRASSAPSPTAQVTPSESSGPAHATPTTARPVASSTPTPSPDSPDTTAPTRPPNTIELPSGAVVGLSFAAGVGTALAVSRLHRRRRHRTPRSGPDLSAREPEAPPVVRRLRRADLSARESGHRDPAQATPENGGVLHLFPLASSGRVVLGVRDDEDVTAQIGGLIVGLAGPGGPAAARALLLALLTHAGDHDVEIVIPQRDAAALFALTPEEVDELAQHVRALRVTFDLGAALRLLESERIHRARLLDTTTYGQDLAAVREADPTEPLPRLVLAAAPSKEHERRLEALTTAAGVYDMAIIGLGGLPAGATVHLDHDGHVTAVDGADAGQWQGLRMFHLTTGDARQVLDVIRSAHGAPEPEADSEPADQAETTDRAPAPPVLKTSEAAEERPVQLQVLGLPIVKVGDREVETGIRGKGRELLSYLAVYADGATRDAILAAMWPDVDHKHAVMRFHAALHDVRRTLRRATGLVDENFIVVRADRYRIDPELVSVDLWRFRTALHRAAQAPDDQTRAAFLQEAADTYEGHLVAEATYEQAYEWIEPEREALRRQAVEALIHLADLYEQEQPEHSLAVLERARSLDRYAEEIYQRIMKLQARLGRTDAVRRTYRLLETAVEELGVDPSTETQQLLWHLLRPHDGPQRDGR